MKTNTLSRNRKILVLAIITIAILLNLFMGANDKNLDIILTMELVFLGFIVIILKYMLEDFKEYISNWKMVVISIIIPITFHLMLYIIHLLFEGYLFPLAFRSPLSLFSYFQALALTLMFPLVFGIVFRVIVLDWVLTKTSVISAALTVFIIRLLVIVGLILITKETWLLQLLEPTAIMLFIYYFYSVNKNLTLGVVMDSLFMLISLTTYYHYLGFVA